MIYFIQEGRRGTIKIGYTESDPGSRLRSLRSCNPSLYLLGTMAGTRIDEARLHYRFQEHRVLGEWFTPTQALVDFITEHTLLADWQCDVRYRLFGERVTKGSN